MPTFVLIGTTAAGHSEYLETDSDMLITCKAADDPAVVFAAVTTSTPEQLEADVVELIKAEAGRRILREYEDWRQRNMIRREVVLGRIETPSGPETTELAELVAAFAWIDAVRAASDALEADPPEDISDDANWPAAP